MKTSKYSHRDILEFIDSQRLREYNRKRKEIYVSWLVNQYELRCRAEVKKSSVNTDTE